MSGPTVSFPLTALGLSYQKPCYRDVARKESEVEFFLNQKFPMIQRLAKKMGPISGLKMKREWGS